MGVLKMAFKGLRSKGKQAGFTLLELVIVLGVLGILMSVASKAMNNGNLSEQYILQSDIDRITTQAVKFARGRQFTDVSIAKLCQDGYLDGTICGASNNGTAANPWGGNYTLVANSANPNRFDLTITKVPGNVGPEMARNYSQSARTSQFTTATQTLLLVYGSI
jgi:prepilin-type N-terminal cleavage/methylation domain-containing protein